MPGTGVSYSTGGTEAQIEGEVIAAEPPSRLLTTFSLRYDSEVRGEPPTRLSWETTPMGEVCRLSVTHDQLQDSPRTARDLSICMPSILSNLKVLLETGRPRLIKAIVVDCAVPSIVCMFWARALGYVMQGPPPTEEDDFVGIADPLGVGPEL